jgi:hypothetical protein
VSGRATVPRAGSRRRCAPCGAVPRERRVGAEENQASSNVQEAKRRELVRCDEYENASSLPHATVVCAAWPTSL